MAALRPPGWQPGQLAARVGFGAGMDFEQPEHPDHQIGVNLHRPASLIPVGAGHHVRRGQPAQVIGFGFGSAITVPAPAGVTLADPALF